MKLIPIGTNVKLHVDSMYFEQGFDKKTKQLMVGQVTKHWEESTHPYTVRFSNGYFDRYRTKDLVVLENNNEEYLSCLTREVYL